MGSITQGRIIEIKPSGDSEINSGEYNLKSLIIGFPQLRGRIENTEKIKNYSLPHIDDIIPLLRNHYDHRLDSFLSWISNLYGESQKETNPSDTKGAKIIKYVFEIISDITGKQIEFITVQQFSPPIIIISTPSAPNGIKINLISQGFKIVIGWIGYFIQRRIESFPLSSPSKFSFDKSILIIDEIDSSIHPLWQARLLQIIQKRFPGIQIICTTHSPLMVAGHDRDQILEIKDSEEGLNVYPIEFDTWAISYRDILKEIFNTTDFIPKYTKEELEAKLEEYKDDPVKTEEIQEVLTRLNENEEILDEQKKYENKLKIKEQELDKLITNYRHKLKL